MDDDLSPILAPLNEKQRQAVSAENKNMLILAGAGSGKTRVLVHRIAWVIQVENASPHSIFAVTFTNKAAKEMRARAEKLLSMSIADMWIGTFHGLAHRLLRRHSQEAGLGSGFQIIDSQDQLRLIKRVLKTLQLDDEKWPPKQAQHFINGRKDEGIRPQHMDTQGKMFEATMARVYQAYEDICRQSDLIDFAEILLRAHELLRDNAELLAHYQQRFSHILVDEFQDTNTIQYAWLRLLAGTQNQIFIVGDDDQSIYGWRGAKVENLMRLEKDFPGIEMVRLEQNYRSTANILAAANAVIAKNTGRLGKTLWTEDGSGSPLQVFAALNERHEAQYVIETIQQGLLSGRKHEDFAILYRSNAQSRIFEETFLSAAMPYRVFGGLRFFERAEIKDLLAYLRLINNQHDDAAFDRIINTPTRGIGEKTLIALRACAKDHQQSYSLAAQQLLSENTLPARAANALQGFLQLMAQMAQSISKQALSEQVENVLQTSTLLDYYRNRKGESAIARVENLEEMVTAARQFEQEHDLGQDTLNEFLSHTALEAGEGQAPDSDDYVQLMTLHSAKGLEFSCVFLVGMEQGLFPHQMSMDDPARLEEERRLCYVGITRARQQLVITHAEERRLYGRTSFPRRSFFIDDIPEKLINFTGVSRTSNRESRKPAPRWRPSSPKPMVSTVKQEEAEGMALGQQVYHAKFGDGVILACEGSGRSARVHVNFETAGRRWLMISHARLQAL